MSDQIRSQAEQLAQRFHELYEELAPKHGYETREASRKPWADVPAQNKALMIDVCSHLLTALAARDPRPLSGEAVEKIARQFEAQDDYTSILNGDPRLPEENR